MFVSYATAFRVYTLARCTPSVSKLFAARALRFKGYIPPQERSNYRPRWKYPEFEEDRYTRAIARAKTIGDLIAVLEDRVEFPSDEPDRDFKHVASKDKDAEIDLSSSSPESAMVAVVDEAEGAVGSDDSAMITELKSYEVWRRYDGKVFPLPEIARPPKTFPVKPEFSHLTWFHAAKLKMKQQQLMDDVEKPSLEQQLELLEFEAKLMVNYGGEKRVRWYMQMLVPTRNCDIREKNRIDARKVADQMARQKGAGVMSEGDKPLRRVIRVDQAN